LLGLLPLLPLLALALSALVPQQRFSLALLPGGTAISDPFLLEGGLLGSPRLDLQAVLPPDTSLELGVELLDAAGQPVLQLDKQGWRASGLWVEGGESGRWEEADTALALDLRPPRTGRYRLRLRLEELLDATGRPLANPLTVRATLRHHSVDAPLLVFTAAVGQIMVWILRASVYGSGRGRWVRRAEEGRLGLRQVMGGPGLLRVEVQARYELAEGAAESAAVPSGVPLRLSLSDPRGRRLLQHAATLRLSRHRDDEDLWLTARLVVFLRLPEPASYRVLADLPERLAAGRLAAGRRAAGRAVPATEAGPPGGDGPWELEWLELRLSDGVRTAAPVPLLPLEPVGAAA
jgi:hypothetical protein